MMTTFSHERTLSREVRPNIIRLNIRCSCKSDDPNAAIASLNDIRKQLKDFIMSKESITDYKQNAVSVREVTRTISNEYMDGGVKRTESKRVSDGYLASCSLVGILDINKNSIVEDFSSIINASLKYKCVSDYDFDIDEHTRDSEELKLMSEAIDVCVASAKYISDNSVYKNAKLSIDDFTFKEPGFNTMGRSFKGESALRDETNNIITAELLRDIIENKYITVSLSVCMKYSLQA